MIRTRLAIAVLALLLSAGCGGSGGGGGGEPAPTSNAGDLILTLSERSGSGESGEATFAPLGKRTKIVLKLEDRSASPVAQPQPAHIHRGSCAKLDPSPAYGLAAVEDGTSTSTVAVPLSTLRGSPFAVDVHESAAQIDTHVACGDLEDARLVDPLGHNRIDE
jgi:hypothetical protein